MNTLVRLGAGMLRGVWAAVVGLFALFALFLEVFVQPGGESRDDQSAKRNARDLRDANGTLGEFEQGFARHPQPGDSDY